MRYDAATDEFADGAFAMVEGPRAKSVALALRHARAMKAVLLAAKGSFAALKRKKAGLNAADYAAAWAAVEAADSRLFRACERLAKIEKEVSRG